MGRKDKEGRSDRTREFEEMKKRKQVLLNKQNMGVRCVIGRRSKERIVYDRWLCRAGLKY